MKKITMFLMVVIVLFPSISYASFDTSLGQKSSGASVVQLQQFLISKGLLTSQATGYFGSLTKAALVAWQTSVGISPASGFFGMLSRSYLNSNSNSSTTAMPSGLSVVPGCLTGALYSMTTGASCTGTTPVMTPPITVVAPSPAPASTTPTTSSAPIVPITPYGANIVIDSYPKGEISLVVNGASTTSISLDMVQNSNDDIDITLYGAGFIPRTEFHDGTMLYMKDQGTPDCDITNPTSGRCSEIFPNLYAPDGSSLSFTVVKYPANAVPDVVADSDGVKHYSYTFAVANGFGAKTWVVFTIPVN